MTFEQLTDYCIALFPWLLKLQRRHFPVGSRIWETGHWRNYYSDSRIRNQMLLVPRSDPKLSPEFDRHLTELQVQQSLSVDVLSTFCRFSVELLSISVDCTTDDFTSPAESRMIWVPRFGTSCKHMIGSIAGLQKVPS